MAFYPSIRTYIEDASELEEKICRIKAIIPILYDSMASAALEDDITEYRLDDGQTKINVKKRSAEEIMKSIKALEQMVGHYANEYNGRVVRVLNHEDIRFLN